jgi:hypothetical protein
LTLSVRQATKSVTFVQTAPKITQLLTVYAVFKPGTDLVCILVIGSTSLLFPGLTPMQLNFFGVFK